MFNFKDSCGQQAFCEIPNNSVKLRNNFKKEGNFLKKAATFQKNLKGVFHQSFKKIRGTKKKFSFPK